MKSYAAISKIPNGPTIEFQRPTRELAEVAVATGQYTHVEEREIEEPWAEELRDAWREEGLVLS